MVKEESPTMYAIRHRASGFYLPARYSGHSWIEPRDIKNNMPRLHRSAEAALRCLKVYCRGCHQMQTKPRYKPGTQRNIGHFEVVKVTYVIEPL